MSVKVMSIVWEHFPNGGGEKLVLLALADWADDEGYRIWPSIAAISKKTNLGERQVQRIMSKFVDAGILTITGHEHGGRGRSRHYRMNIDAVKGDRMSPFADAKRVTSEPLKGDICDIKGDIHVTRSVIEPPIEPLIPPLPPQGDGGGEFTPEPDQPHLAEQTEPQRAQNQRLPLNLPKDSPENIQYPDPDFPEKPPKSFTDMAGAVWAAYPETRGTKGHKAKAFAALSAAIRRGGTGPPEWVAEARRIAAAVARYRAFCEATGQKNKDAFRWLKDGDYDQNYRITAENRRQASADYAPGEAYRHIPGFG